MEQFIDRTKPDVKKLRIIESGQVFHAEFYRPDPAHEGAGEDGTPLNAATFNSFYADIKKAIADAAVQRAVECAVERASGIIETAVERVTKATETAVAALKQRIESTEMLLDNLINPTTGEKDSLQNILFSLLHFLADGITAEEFDALNLTAENFDTLPDLTAIDFDFKGKAILQGIANS